MSLDLHETIIASTISYHHPILTPTNLTSFSHQLFKPGIIYQYLLLNQTHCNILRQN